MKRAVLLCAASLGLAALATGCTGSGSESAQDTTAPAATAAETQPAANTGAADAGAATDVTSSECDAENLNLVNDGELTIGWGGGETQLGWAFNDPYGSSASRSKGYENALAYAIAEQLGFGDVRWRQTTFKESIAPGPKKWDFNMQQIRITRKRAKTVHFSESYYDNTQAMVSVKGSRVDGATSLADLRDARFGVFIRSKRKELHWRPRRWLTVVKRVLPRYDFVVYTIRPDQKPVVFDNQNDAVGALQKGQVDAIVTDLDTGLTLRSSDHPAAATLIIAGRFPAGELAEQFGLTFEKGNPLVTCVNKAIKAIKADGTLDAIAQKWLADESGAPIISK